MEIKLTEEQIKALQNGEDITIKGPCNKQEPKPFPQKGDKYCYIASNGNVLFTPNDNTTGDLYRISVSNAYRTTKEAEQAIKLIQAKQRLKLAIEIANDGWTPNWEASSEYTFSVILTNRKPIIEFYRANKIQPNWMHMKSKEIAEQIVKTHKTDIELILSE